MSESINGVLNTNNIEFIKAKKNYDSAVDTHDKSFEFKEKVDAEKGQDSVKLGESQNEVAAAAKQESNANDTINGIIKNLTAKKGELNSLLTKLDSEIIDKNEVQTKIDTIKKEIEAEETKLKEAEKDLEASKQVKTSAETALKAIKSQLEKTEQKLNEATQKENTDRQDVDKKKETLDEIEQVASNSEEGKAIKGKIQKESKEFAEKYDDGLNEYESDPDFVEKLMQSAKMYSDGKIKDANQQLCASGVNDILEDAGIVKKNETRRASAKELTDAFDNNDSFNKINLDDVSIDDLIKTKGIVFVLNPDVNKTDSEGDEDKDKTDYEKYGHAFITLGDGKEVSDRTRDIDVEKIKKLIDKGGVSAYKIIDKDKENKKNSDFIDNLASNDKLPNVPKDEDDDKNITVKNKDNTGVKGKEKAIRKYLENNNKKPIGENDKGESIYSKKDKDEAELAVTSLQKDVVDKAKKINKIKESLKNENLTSDDRKKLEGELNTYVDKNGKIIIDDDKEWDIPGNYNDFLEGKSNVDLASGKVFALDSEEYNYYSQVSDNRGRANSGISLSKINRVDTSFLNKVMSDNNINENPSATIYNIPKSVLTYMNNNKISNNDNVSFNSISSLYNFDSQRKGGNDNFLNITELQQAANDAKKNMDKYEYSTSKSEQNIYNEQKLKYDSANDLINLIKENGCSGIDINKLRNLMVENGNPDFLAALK